MPEPSCYTCAKRSIYESREWLHATCPKWRHPYEKDILYDHPCELYEPHKPIKERSDDLSAKQ